jgi:hypothetical protein
MTTQMATSKKRDQTSTYKWRNWHNNYDAEASPDRKWIKVLSAAVNWFFTAPTARTPTK